MVCLAHPAPKANTSNTSSSNTSSVMKKTTTTKRRSKGRVVSPKTQLMLREFTALRDLLPASKPASSALDVVLEAIDYIQSLEQKLLSSRADVDVKRLQSHFWAMHQHQQHQQQQQQQQREEHEQRRG